MKHGGNIIETAKQLGCSISDLIDMSSNLTPFGMADGLGKHLCERIGEIAYLPETASSSLREVFAATYSIAADQVLAGNGTTEFIYALPEALKPTRGLIVNPTYGDYRPACEWCGVRADSFALSEANDFTLDFGELAAGLTGGELVFICNPNNPTGRLTPSENLLGLARTCGDSNFLVDESYLPFCREPSLLETGALPDNLFVLNSFSKIYGIPGLRLGFLAGSATSITKLFTHRKPWGVNRLAQIAGEYVLLQGESYVERVVRFVERERQIAHDFLGAIPGVEVVPGCANFILSRLTGPMRAGLLQEKLLAERIMIRNCDNFAGLDGRYFRISMKDAETNQHCLKILRQVIGEYA